MLYLAPLFTTEGKDRQLTWLKKIFVCFIIPNKICIAITDGSYKQYTLHIFIYTIQIQGVRERLLFFNISARLCQKQHPIHIKTPGYTMLHHTVISHDCGSSMDAIIDSRSNEPVTLGCTLHDNMCSSLQCGAIAFDFTV